MNAPQRQARDLVQRLIGLSVIFERLKLELVNQRGEKMLALKQLRLDLSRSAPVSADIQARISEAEEDLRRLDGHIEAAIVGGRSAGELVERLAESAKQETVNFSAPGTCSPY